MLYSSTTVALLCTLVSGSVIKRASEPCPYHRVDDKPGQPLIKDEYIVHLHPDYSIDQHFGFLGKNLTNNATKFSNMQAINSYSILIDNKTMHNEIRYDPGVESVSHNMVSRPKYHWYKDDNPKEPEPTRRRKRWTLLNVALDWWPRMSVKWDKQQSIIDGIKEKANILEDSGKGVDIYIVDTGIRISHELFNTKDRGGARNFKNNYGGDNDFDDKIGHGTMVAGMAHMNAPWATVVNVKVEGPDTDLNTVIQAINDIIQEHNDRKNDPDFADGKDWRGSVINMSFEETDLPIFRTAIADAIKAGIQVTTSAGNDGQDGGTVPCGFPDVICVGGVSQSYKKQAGSNFGTGVSIYAPSDTLQGPGHTGDKEWVWMSGTSLAAPAVAAVASIFISYENIRDNSATVRQRLMQNAHNDILVDEPNNKAIPNVLVHTGLEHPDRKPFWPYVGLSADQIVPEDGEDNVSGLDGMVDGSDLPTFASPDGEPTNVQESKEFFVPAFRLEDPPETQAS